MVSLLFDKVSLAVFWTFYEKWEVLTSLTILDTSVHTNNILHI